MKITAIKQQVKRAGRYSIFVDDAYAFSLSESALLEQGIASGQELDAARLAELTAASGTDKAYGNALRYAVLRPRSRWETETYLQRKAVDEPVAQSIMERLERFGMLGDLAFARAWTANRRQLKNISRRKLQLELQQKHVPGEIITQVLAEDAPDDLATLRELIHKKRVRYPDNLKLMQYLARQGFGYDDIKRAMQTEKEAAETP